MASTSGTRLYANLSCPNPLAPHTACTSHIPTATDGRRRWTSGSTCARSTPSTSSSAPSPPCTTACCCTRSARPAGPLSRPVFAHLRPSSPVFLHLRPCHRIGPDLTQYTLLPAFAQPSLRLSFPPAPRSHPAHSRRVPAGQAGVVGPHARRDAAAAPLPPARPSGRPTGAGRTVGNDGRVEGGGREGGGHMATISSSGHRRAHETSSGGLGLPSAALGRREPAQMPPRGRDSAAACHRSSPRPCCVADHHAASALLWSRALPRNSPRTCCCGDHHHKRRRSRTRPARRRRCRRTCATSRTSSSRSCWRRRAHAHATLAPPHRLPCFCSPASACFCGSVSCTFAPTTSTPAHSPKVRGQRRPFPLLDLAHAGPPAAAHAVIGSPRGAGRRLFYLRRGRPAPGADAPPPLPPRPLRLPPPSAAFSHGLCCR